MLKQEIVIQEGNRYIPQTKLNFGKKSLSTYDSFRDYLEIENNGTKILIEIDRNKAVDIFKDLLEKAEKISRGY